MRMRIAREVWSMNGGHERSGPLPVSRTQLSVAQRSSAQAGPSWTRHPPNHAIRRRSKNLVQWLLWELYRENSIKDRRIPQPCTIQILRRQDRLVVNRPCDAQIRIIPTNRSIRARFPERRRPVQNLGPWRKCHEPMPESDRDPQLSSVLSRKQIPLPSLEGRGGSS